MLKAPNDGNIFLKIQPKAQNLSSYKNAKEIAIERIALINSIYYVERVYPVKKKLVYLKYKLMGCKLNKKHLV
jgi:hypothetical protein